MKKAPTLAEASPYKSVAEELDSLRQMFRSVCQSYTVRVEAEMIALRERVVAAGAIAAEHEKSEHETEVAAASSRSGPVRQTSAARHLRASAMSQVHDLRDMLTVLRTLQIKPAEGRRKDLKKVESTLEELRMLAEGLD